MTQSAWNPNPPTDPTTPSPRAARQLETRSGPFMNEDGDWWVPVDAMGYLAARRLVKEHLDDPASRLTYHGRMDVWLDMDDEGCGDETCTGRFFATAWHFEEVNP